MLYLRNQYDLLNNVESHMRDTSNYRWSEIEIYGALNDAVRSWHGRVSVPATYAPGTNWPDDVHVIDVPVGIDPETAVIQIRYLPVENSVDQVDTWYDVNGWRTEPTEAFGGQLRVNFQPTSEYRLLYWFANGTMPTTAPTLGSELSDVATSVTLTTTADVGESGFLQIENEWIHYRGIERGATTLTCQNLTRGLLTSIAATHATSTPVYWCVGTTRQDLYNQLLDQARAFLHELTLIAAAPQSRDVHERMVSYYQARADAYWRKHTPERRARWKVEMTYDGAW
ncbi:MAG: hypothetical protein KAX65_01290 [Caldilineaceae bacterium]|nr:hypothetical protein [Caldilineaceae bacterium]